MEWATALGNWLEPHHNHTRPPPHVVLAEAARQTELKTGLPLRGVDLKALNNAANGPSKKDEEAPPIKEFPGLVVKFFDGEQLLISCWSTTSDPFSDMNARFNALLSNKSSPSQLLHVATITQEVGNHRRSPTLD